MIGDSRSHRNVVKEDVTLATTGMDRKAGEELAQLKAIVAEQQQRLDALEAPNGASANGDGDKAQKSTRRQMFKLAGAAAVGAAGAAALRAIPGAAYDGQVMTVGSGVLLEYSGNTTGITSYGALNTNIFGYAYYGGIGVYSRSFSGIGSYVRSATYDGVFANNAGNNEHGVIAYGGSGVTGIGGNGPGLHAQTNATGSEALFAYTSAAGSIAINAHSTTSPAISALSNGTFFSPGIATEGYSGGIWAFSSNPGAAGAAAIGYLGGPDLKLAGSGRMVQLPNIPGGVGAPNFTPAAGYFEMVRAKDGAMWINRGTGTLRASWKRINAVRVDTADGTGAPFAPFRVFDTRSGAIKAAGSTTVVPIAGLGAGASSIPSDAVAVIGNLTATQYTGGGFLSIAPAGVAVTTSAVNFITGQKAIANSFIVGLGTGVTNGGKIQIKVAGHASHFLVDITGYFQ
jgi:hypothetical protein